MTVQRCPCPPEFDRPSYKFSGKVELFADGGSTIQPGGFILLSLPDVGTLGAVGAVSGANGTTADPTAEDYPLSRPTLFRTLTARLGLNALPAGLRATLRLFRNGTPTGLEVTLAEGSALGTIAASNGREEFAVAAPETFDVKVTLTNVGAAPITSGAWSFSATLA